MKYHSVNLSVIVYLFSSFTFSAQQIPDTSFVYTIKKPAYEPGKGPVILIDQAHNNFHTLEGGFFSFAKLIEQDGYQVDGLINSITSADLLNDCDIFVIANALHPETINNYFLPISFAFSNEEIVNIKAWVSNGGSLFLIADHMPFAGAAYELGKVFGFEFLNGFAYTGKDTWPPSVFSITDNTLHESIITTGMNESDSITQVSTFLGSAFKSPKDAIPVLSFLDEHYSLQPDTAWIFNENTPSQKLGSFSQGAILKYGKGKVAVFGEAAMFTTQIVNGNFKVGFNSEAAPQNARFTLNLIHWLDGRIE